VAGLVVEVAQHRRQAHTRLKKYLDGTRTPTQVHEAVIADVQRAAQLIDTGLSSYLTSGPEWIGVGRPVRAGSC
jgi:hypothetical protein